jgi:hypothetical protein
LQHCRLAEHAPDFDRMLDAERAFVVEGALLERLGHLDAAEALLRPQMQRPQKPFNSLLGCQTLARIELARRRPLVALAWVERGIATFDRPPSGEILYLKGQCLEFLQRNEAAQEVYRQIPPESSAYKRAQMRLKRLTHPDVR